jgi:hypothetical protein
MASSDAEDVLRGKTLDVYRYALKSRKPTGVREVQRALKFSSPRLAFYHLNKLEEAGLLKKGADGYVVERVVLQNSVRLMRLLVPRYFFYSLFFVTTLIIHLTVFRPAVLHADYIFGLFIGLAAAASFIYETVRIMIRRSLRV